mmetsp:Transcript_8304/g.37627  ORF Transcript_8304/g.37627 Transcript_8304/m.37627 type:complete len:204 (-) Transcript_8304:1101-1712(-)
MAAPAAPAARSIVFNDSAPSVPTSPPPLDDDVSSPSRSSAMSSRRRSLPSNVSFCSARPRSRDWSATTARYVSAASSDSIGGGSVGVSGRSGPRFDATGLGVDAIASPPGVTAPGVTGSGVTATGASTPAASPPPAALAALAASRFSRCISSYIASNRASARFSSTPPPADFSQTLTLGAGASNTRAIAVSASHSYASVGMDS